MNITYISACMDASGYAEASRNHIAALDSVGVVVNVVPISFEKYKSDLGNLGIKIQKMVGKNNPGKIQIIHATPENYPKLKDNSKYNIGYVAWETDKLPEKWISLCNSLQEIWVPSLYNKEIFTNSGITVPIFVMPHPFHIDESIVDEEVNSEILTNVNKDDFLFYSIFQWSERKNPIDLLKAYFTEFSSSEKVVLVIKTYLIDPNNKEESNKIKEMISSVKKKLYLKNYPKILLISSLLSKNQIKMLHRRCSCYISLHRSEGFGIPLAEAMLEKKPVITTGYGGQVEFVPQECLVKYNMTPVYGMPWDLYTGNMNWAAPDILDARKKMRYMFEHENEAKKIGEAGYREIVNKFSWNTVGKLMQNRLNEIIGSL